MLLLLLLRLCSCLLANQGQPAACDEYKIALSKCASSAVPIMAAVKSRCQPYIHAFDACLNENRNATDQEVQANCGHRLKALWQCTEATKKEEERKLNAPKAADSPV